MKSISKTILWRRIDQPGHESARLIQAATDVILSGTAVFQHDRKPVRLDYSVVCDGEWRTRLATIDGWIGNQSIEAGVEVDLTGTWRFNGKVMRDVQGAIDVDLNFSPSTNILPIRRLQLEVGEEATVRAAWLRFPTFRLEALDQIYRRLSPDTYQYESAGGAFVTTIKVDDDGFVVDYPGIWEKC